MKILNYGSLNYDYVYQVDHMVLAGETLSAGEMKVFCGGKGMNQSIALAKAGISVYHAGMVGEDGQALLELCSENRVNTEFIKQIPGKSGHTIIQLDKRGQNCILLFGGANKKQTRDHMDQVLSHFERGDLLLLQNEVNELAYLIDQAYARGMEVALNPSPYNEALNLCDLSKISLFFINEIEGEQITGEKKPEEILNQLRERYPHARVVLTLGESGCIYQDGNQRIRQPIFKVRAVDTTAAGDTFTGYFISSILNKFSVEEGLALAARASAITVSRTGAAASIPRWEEVQKECESLHEAMD